jgi:tRNA-(ms[2]io[6]A)-hydroxylase
VLSEHLEDEELASFYSRLMASEAGHYTLFLRLARSYGDRTEVDRLWSELLAYEGEVIKEFGTQEHIHG